MHNARVIPLLSAVLSMTITFGEDPAEAQSPAESVVDGSVVREVWPGHYDLLKTRSQRNREMLDASLRRPDARPVTVAVWQMRNRCGGEQGKRDNLRRMIEAIECAGREGVQILALPEMCLPGYFTASAGTPAEAARANRQLADEPSRSEYLKQLCDAARANRLVLAFGFCETQEGKYYNSIGVIDADGAWLGTRRKNPLSPGPYDLESFTEPPPAERCAVFRTRYATVGVLNCFDGEFPETARQMRLAGAEVLLWCNAATGNVVLGSSNRIHHSASYAQANRMWVACCNAVGKECYGTSVIVGPSGDPLVVLPTDREVFGVATINLSLGADWDRWRRRLDPQLLTSPQ